VCHAATAAMLRTSTMLTRALPAGAEKRPFSAIDEQNPSSSRCMKSSGSTYVKAVPTTLWLLSQTRDSTGNALANLQLRAIAIDKRYAQVPPHEPARQSQAAAPRPARVKECAVQSCQFTANDCRIVEIAVTDSTQGNTSVPPSGNCVPWRVRLRRCPPAA
jgi:hypothetical protein